MTKIISISDEAYNELARMKDGFSFSKVIVKLVREKKKNSIMKFAGAWDNEEALKIKREIMEERKIKSRRF